MTALRDHLAFLVGEFSGQETNHASAWAPASVQDSRAFAHFEDGPDVLVQRQSQSGGFAALNVFIPAGDDILLYSFDTVGHVPEPPALGTWVDGALVFLRTTPRGHSRTKFRGLEGGYTWSKEFMAREGTEWTMLVDGTLHSAG